MSSLPRVVLVAGSAHLVIQTGATAPARAGNGKIDISVGGTAYETASCLSRLDTVPRLLTAWNASELSRLLGAHIASAGIQLIPDEVAGMDIGAEVRFGAHGQTGHVASIPISSHQFGAQRLRQALNGVHALYMDATLSLQTIADLGESAEALSIPMVAFGVAPELAAKLLPLAGKLTALVLSPLELESLLEETDLADASEIAHRMETMVFLARGRGGGVIYHPDGERTRVLPPETEGGSALLDYPFAVAVIEMLLQGHELQDAANAAHAAALELACGGAVSNGLSSMVEGLVDQAEHDTLTGLLTRGGFSGALRRGLGHRGALLLLDLDNFKQVNDTHGHDAGDQVLKDVSDVIQGCIRAGDFAARWGGDEFVVYLAKTDVERAQKVVQRMRATAAKRNLHGVTLSIGVTVVDAGEPIADAISRADSAMYRVKRSGKDNVMVDAEGLHDG
ncbi:GGDEF domain-containing protein [Noviherbaspirillum galbum]|uniref:diguanylate cyclase n=1 Tax=Noviherbaspirillum galbum TaxID=2709383 RepID=A0A6B3SRY5_9BURK|nr:GGDEF domain-containing protein [Noviherbaspirillum galbum]NEX63411.1 GGDEF domain-containing protein [Noviherbaspirillum galbum]